MIPKLNVNDEFLKSVRNEDRHLWEKMTESVMELDYVNGYTIPIYNTQAVTFVGENWLFNEYKGTEIEFYGYCPSENALRKIAFPFKGIGGNYMVTARLVEQKVAEDDEDGWYYNEDGDDTEMIYSDYIDEYGQPTTQYQNQLVQFTVYYLKENYEKRS